MKYIVKNTTDADIEIDDMGVTLPAGEVYHINDDYTESTQFDTLISAGEVVFCNADGTALTVSESQNIHTNLSQPQYDQGYSKDEVEQLILTNKNYTDTKIQQITNGAPELLDTISEIAEALGGDADFATSMNAKIEGKADASHSHRDKYYTQSYITTKLAGKSNTDHDHTASHYTKAEMDTKLRAKSNANHSHNYAAVNHEHDYSPSNHIHDTRYYTQDQVDARIPVFGQNYASVSSDSVSTVTTSYSYTTKIILTVDVEVEAYYRLGWAYMWNYDHTSYDFLGQVTHNDSEIWTHVQEPKDSAGSFGSTGTNQQFATTFHDELYLGVGQHSFKLNWKSGYNRRRASIWDSKFEFWRVK